MIFSGLSESASLTAVTSPESGAIDVGDRLHRLDLGVGRVLGDLGADLGRLVEDDLAERVLRVPGDPEGGLVALDPRPVVLGVVLSSSG